MTRTDLQKILFLFNHENPTKYYEFLPYKYGCFSFLANQDLKTLTKYNLIHSEEYGWQINSNKSFIPELKANDRIFLQHFYNKYKNYKGKELIKFVYENFPYYATRSEIAAQIIDQSHLDIVKSLIPTSQHPSIFTIGYEGKSVEEYFNILLKNSVDLLLDVRKNPLSMKYGFSKKQMKSISEKMGIEYMHIPTLGIESSKRQKLETKEDYQELFEVYKKTVLIERKQDINLIGTYFKKYRRVALTCFEKSADFCHRKHVAESIEKQQKFKYPLIHL
ncbi:MAG: DUF488 family protein [Candidatus Kapaibacterium sp.]